jgi:hypothetical protein
MAKKSKAKASKKPVRAAKRPSNRRAKSAKASRRPSAKAVRKTAKNAGKHAAKKGTKLATSARARGARGAGSAAKQRARTTAGSTPSAAVLQARKAARARTEAVIGKRPNLDRERRTIREEEEMVPSPPSSLNMDRTASAARTGRAEFEQRLRQHTSTGPAMTGGDVDADWEDAESVGDEAPGGDNPTPDQDVVDEIGRAMGIEYDDDEELQGGDELAERDRHRWELDPASKDEFEDE